ncbi:hypothetical protein [Nocardioides sp. GY 10127]|uniref:hypothetical protein n=1 Tax=Nocardioides sp. GY 10127 TaxID=2569762 RepID=UPI0010A7B167|nr:hypothetical protein [Nocardioides sp. GY 10127]TIC85545.1 hypothetical protein E8D37_02650 [Nocardioides sp. GY 10127]
MAISASRGDLPGPGRPGARTTGEGDIGVDHLVVGLSGSPASRRALAWALGQVERRGHGGPGGWVEPVTVWPLAGGVVVHQVPGHFCVARDEAARAQAEALAAVGPADGRHLRITPRLENGTVADVLADASAGAGLLVLGVGHPLVDGAVARRTLTDAVLRRWADRWGTPQGCPLVLVDPGGRARLLESIGV